MLKKILNYFKSEPDNYFFCMNHKEKELLCKYLKNSLQHLEFGSGGSTIFALMQSNANIISVESSRKWILQLCFYKIIRKAIISKRLKFFHADIGKTAQWGYPCKYSKKWKNYSDIKSKFFKEADKIDTVLVDGRFRVACVCACILKYDKNINILIHDYDREEYHIIEKFLDKIEYADTLFVFKVKDNINLEDVKVIYKKYLDVDI